VSLRYLPPLPFSPCSPFFILCAFSVLLNPTDVISWCALALALQARLSYEASLGENKDRIPGLELSLQHTLQHIDLLAQADQNVPANRRTQLVLWSRLMFAHCLILRLPLFATFLFYFMGAQISFFVLFLFLFLLLSSSVPRKQGLSHDRY